MMDGPPKGGDGAETRHRRRQLLTAGAGLVASSFTGCLTQLAGDQATPSATATQPMDTSAKTPSPAPHRHAPSVLNAQAMTPTTEGELLASEAVLDPGRFTHLELRLDRPRRMHLTGVNEGAGTVDVLLLTPERSFAEYQEGTAVELTGPFVRTDIETIDHTVDLPPGRYFLVIDNTARYGATPSGTVRFEFTLTLSTASTSTTTRTARQTEPTESPTETTETTTEPTVSPTETTESPTETPYTPSQPKILAVTDNRGHTFTFDGTDPPREGVWTDGEVVVEDGTEIELCVSELAKQADDTVTYGYRFLNDAEHPDNPRKVTPTHGDPCWRWTMRRTDYQSQWGYRIWIRNQDEIYYQNQSVESDFSVDVYYTNLTLAEEDG